ncbi:hypothetical protein HPB49_012394 [Dermacentor silvarum]|uniref:Uncharacterized protein n=1 Tax=Dermacentor silvarum TaxID=543639 RepID=A0ACB8CX06_DERSI|nr:hypothetical protein HPB49_012394 [Dermacentor silvarum]
MGVSLPSSYQDIHAFGGMEKRLAASLHSSTPATSGATVLPADAPAARLCHLVLRPDFDGYGFRIVAGKMSRLPRVNAVEPGSPADVADLRVNDTIVEVNGASLEGLGHQDVVQLIKSAPNEVRLLVVDDDTAAWYDDHGIAVRGDLPNVIQVIKVNAAASKTSETRSQAAASSSASPGSATTSSQECPGGLRLCYLRKWPSFEGYGFCLRGGEKHPGYFIEGVVAGGPAHLGGLRDDDRLVEVNAMPAENMSYREITERIGKKPDQVDLLVIDRETDELFASRNQKPSGQSDGVQRRWTPARTTAVRHWDIQATEGKYWN